MQQEFTEGLPKSQWLCKNFTERFWRDVVKTESCWLWQSQVSRYPGISRGLSQVDARLFPPRNIKVHRASWIMHFGVIPDGMCVCHKCDNTKCVRPDHLFLGNHSDNMKDMANKGRSPWGENSPVHKHTFKIIRHIRHLYASGIKQIDIARIYGVDRGNMCRIVHRKIWRYLPD